MFLPSCWWRSKLWVCAYYHFFDKKHFQSGMLDSRLDLRTLLLLPRGSAFFIGSFLYNEITLERLKGRILGIHASVLERRKYLVISLVLPLYLNILSGFYFDCLVRLKVWLTLLFHLHTLFSFVPYFLPSSCSFPSIAISLPFLPLFSLFSRSPVFPLSISLFAYVFVVNSQKFNPAEDL